MLPALTTALTCATMAQPLAEPAGAVRYDGDKVVAVVLDDEKIRRAVIGLSRGMWDCHEPGRGLPVHLHMTPEAVGALDDLGLAYVVEVENVQALLDAENARLADAARERFGGTRGELPGTFFDNFRTSVQISDYMNALVEAYPQRVSRQTIGQTLEGREIYAIRVNPGGGPKPVLLFTALIHAREWLAGSSGCYLIDRLVRNPSADPRIEALLNDFEVVLVPELNPDGYAFSWATDRLWRKNRKPVGSGCFGVDNNRNYGAFWQPLPPVCSETYSGTAAFTELENQAMRDFALTLPSIVSFVDLHTPAQVVLSPYSHRIAPPVAEAELFDEMNNRVMRAFNQVAGLVWNAGPGFATLGQPATGSSCDYFFTDFGAISWTWELRPGGGSFVVPPSLIDPQGRELVSAVLALGDAAREVLLRVRFAGPGRPVRVSTVDETPVELRIERGSQLPDLGATRLWWRLGRVGPFSETALVAHEDGSLRGVLPAVPCGAVLQYYVEARTAPGVGGREFTSPAAGADGPYEATASDAEVYASFDMETASGWTGGAQGWVNVDPNGSAAAPEHAAQGTRCWVTRDATPGTGLLIEVNGTLRLTSAPIDLAGRSDVKVSYRRWFCTNTRLGGDVDTLVVEASPDGTSWLAGESVGPGLERGRGWFEHSFRLDDLFAPTAQTRLRFSATDATPASIVEAAVDDVVIFRERCPGPCVADWTRDGTVNSTDVSEFINTWFEDQANGTLNADFDGNGISNSTDVSAFVNAWFGPC